MSAAVVRMRLGARLILVLIGAAMLASCATASRVEPPARAVVGQQAGPTFIWWSRYAHELSNVTHVVNDVWLGTANDNPDKNPAKHRDAWRQHGVVPLDWAGGDVYADEGHDELVRKWSSAISNGHVGIAIDEFGTARDERKRTVIDALATLRDRHPEAYIAVWHAGLLDAEFAEAYRASADLVMLETYIEGAWLLGMRLGFRLQNAREYNIQAIAVPTVAIVENQFAQTRDAVRAQLTWIADNAKDFRGVAIYAPDRTYELVEFADSLIGDIFPGRK